MSTQAEALALRLEDLLYDWIVAHEAAAELRRLHQRCEELERAANDAATSLETISRLAGRKTYGDPPIETYMDDFMQVRGYASSRAQAARQEVAAALSSRAQEQDHG